MTETDKLFAGSIPETYDRLLVPLIFEAYARDLAERIARREPRRVLETAAGTGVVARALAPLLDEGAGYVVTDLNQPMLDYAKGRQGPDGRIEWRQADALSLPFEDAGFDAVCCQFGAMFFPDRVAGFREARRMLRPGGALIFSTWDRIEDNEFADSVTETASRFFPDNPPVFLARTPHGYHDVDAIARDVRDAGFGTVEILTIAETSRAETPDHPAVAYCQGTPLRNELEARDAARLEEITAAATEAIAARFGPGPVSGRIQAHVVVATD